MKSSAKSVSRENVEVTIVKLANGALGWRVRDEGGSPVKLGAKVGKIYGVDNNEVRDTPAYKASLRAINETLRRTIKAKEFPRKRMKVGTGKLRLSTAEQRRHPAADLSD